MGRLALAALGLAVAALVALVAVQSRGDGETEGATDRASDERAGEVAGRPVEAPPREAGQAPARAAQQEASPLPTAAEQAEARRRVAAERERPAHLSPDLIMDHKLKARPMRDARKAYQRGEYELALARAQDALAVEPDLNSARVLAVLSACELGRSALARAHADQLDDMRRTRVMQRCKELGIELGAGDRAGESGQGR